MSIPSSPEVEYVSRTRSVRAFLWTVDMGEVGPVKANSNREVGGFWVYDSFGPNPVRSGEYVVLHPDGRVEPMREDVFHREYVAATAQPLLAEIEELRVQNAALTKFNENWQNDCNTAWAEAQKLREALTNLVAVMERHDCGYAWPDGKEKREHVAEARKALGGS